MQDEIAYGILEMTFINSKITDEKNYEMVLENELPSDWYGISIEDRIAILNEAIAKELRLEETLTYNSITEYKKIL